MGLKTTLLNKELADLMAKTQAYTADNILAAMELKCIPNYYILKNEYFSDKLWKYFEKKLKIKDSEILTITEQDIDSDGNVHKFLKYTINYTDKEDNKLFIIFNDEYRNIDADDYSEYIEAEDKENKITNIIIYHNMNNVDFEKKYLNEINKYLYIQKYTNIFYTLCLDNDGYSLQHTVIKDINYDIELNYGVDFTKYDNHIIKNLKLKKSGLYLFHGGTGCGKTSYIKMLVNRLYDEKTIIYIPSYLVDNLQDSTLISFLRTYENSILVIEDAEHVLITMEENVRNSAVSNILNLTDGLLNDFLNISIIFTLNSDVKNIDKAVKRAGRAVAEVEFKKLSAENATKLSKAIGKNKIYKVETTLADVYNDDNHIKDEIDVVTKKIGFGK